MAPRRTLSDSPFDTLEKTFNLLVAGPKPLAFDGAKILGLPDRSIPLTSSRPCCCTPSTVLRSPRCRHRGLGLGVEAPRRCRHGRSGRCPLTGPAPGRLAHGAGLPGPPVRHRGRDAGGLPRSGGPMRSGPTSAGRTIDLAGPQRSKPTAAQRSGGADGSGQRPGVVGSVPALGPPRSGARPGRAGECHLPGPMPSSSGRPGSAAPNWPRWPPRSVWTYEALKKRRLRAECTLAAWLRSDDYLPFDFVPKATPALCSSLGGRPRQDRSTDRRPEKRRSTPTSRR